jgi:long-subunit acyl-CoA synthetase (AMP-forming)
MAVLTPMRANMVERRAGREAAPPIEAGRTLVDLFFDRVARWSQRPALRYVDGGAWRAITWAEYGNAVREVA